MQEVNQFYQEVVAWLKPLGFSEIYSNHPLSEIREFHFIKDGVRVCCINDSTPYCYLQNDILELVPHVSLRSGQYKIGFEDVIKLVNTLLEQELQLTKQPATGLRIIRLPENIDLEKLKKEWQQ